MILRILTKLIINDFTNIFPFKLKFQWIYIFLILLFFFISSVKEWGWQEFKSGNFNIHENYKIYGRTIIIQQYAIKIIKNNKYITYNR